MPDRSSVIPPSDLSQLDRIEGKLDEVLEFRDQLQALMAAFAGGGSGKVLRMVAKAKGL